MNIKWKIVFIVLFLFSCETLITKKGVSGMELDVRSNAFEEGELIPTKYTCDGKDISPPLHWSKPPIGTKSMVLICDDPDAPMGTWVHWVLYGLQPETLELPEGIANDKDVLSGARHGINDFRNIGYGGPCPPGGSHRYYFKLYAIDKVVDMEAGATKDEILKAIKGHIIAEGQLMGRYRR